MPIKKESIIYRSSTVSEKMMDEIQEGMAEHSIEEVGVATDIGESMCFYRMREYGDYTSILVAQNFWGSFHIKYVWTIKEERRTGLAMGLMLDAFEYAREHDYPFATVTLMSFQVPLFFKKLGFVEELRRDGYSHGASVLYLKKDLTKKLKKKK